MVYSQLSCTIHFCTRICMIMVSPISILQEYTAKNALRLPDYTFLSVGSVTSPSFKCICTCNGKTTTATTTSKKEAKHQAAELMCTALRLNQKTVSSVPTSSVQGVNSVSALNEYCSKNSLSYPDYYDDPEQEGKFVIRCVCAGKISFGFGLNKKVAKQQAASEMLNQLIKIPKVESQNRKDNKLPSTQEVLDAYEKVKRNIEKLCLVEEKASVTALNKKLAECQKLNLSGTELTENLRKLEEANKDLNYYTVFTDYANGQYIEIYKFTSKVDKCSWVFIGKGETPKEAKYIALKEMYEFNATHYSK